MGSCKIQLSNTETNKLTSCYSRCSNWWLSSLLAKYLIPPFLLWSSSTSLLRSFPLLISRISFLVCFQNLEWYTLAPHSEWSILATSPKTWHVAWKYFSSWVLLYIHSAPWISLVEITIQTVFNSFLGCHTRFSH